MASPVTDKDMGWNKVFTSFEVAEGDSAVFVGYLRSSGEYKKKKERLPGEEVTLAQLAAIHEFGTKPSTVPVIPERSFMRSAIDSNHSQLEQMISKLAGKVADGNITKVKALGIIGQFVKQLMKNKIIGGLAPPLQPETIARKGSSKPLIDTGQLINAIDFEIMEGKGD